MADCECDELLRMGQPPLLRWSLFIGRQLSKCVVVRVIRQDQQGRLLWLAGSSPTWEVDVTQGRHLRDVPVDQRPVGGYPLRPGVWRPTNALIYQPAELEHAVWWLFDTDGSFAGWYVNFESRQDSEAGVDVIDHELDVVVAPDRSWQWKDQDSFEAKIGQRGYWSVEKAAEIRAHAEGVVSRVAEGRFPFDDSLHEFQPSRSWPLPPRPQRPSSVLAEPSAAITTG